MGSTEGLPAHMPLYETVLERGQHGVGTMSDEMSIQGGDEMTEERMIRVTKPEALDGEVSIRVFFDYYRPDGRLAKDGFTINDFDGLEPAPPKDWKPYCYDEEHNICSLVGLVNEPPKCWKECPYRKRSD